jgi:carboxynorspermidine decarboxylase
LSCLAGDVIGEYSFDRPLAVGDKLVFTDMAIYSMVKTNTFNGVRLPSILLYDSIGDRIETVRTFGYDDFKNRLS